MSQQRSSFLSSRAALIVRLAFVALLLGSATAGQAQPEPKRIVMLQSFGLRFKPWTDYAERFRAEMHRQSKVPLAFDDHSLFTARLENDKSDVHFVNFLQSIYSEKAPDLVVALGAPAADFVQRYRSRIFPKTPMLFYAVEARRVQYDKLTENDAVVAVAHDFPAAFETILQVLPRTKVIAVVNGASINEKAWQAVFERELAPLGKRVELRWYNRLSFEEILKDAANLPPDSAIFWHLMSIDAAGVVHEGNVALDRLSSSANAPIFSYLDLFFGTAIVGGSMHSLQEGSAVAAAAAIRTLNGEKAGDVITPPTRFTLPRFDWRQMQRFGITEADLPPGSEVLFREQSLWEQYWWSVALVTVIILLQGGLIAGLLYEQRRRQFAEMQSRQRMTELAHVNRLATAGELTASITHELNQPLGAIRLNAETLHQMLMDASPDIGECQEIAVDIERDGARASDTIDHLRRLLKKAPPDQKPEDLNEIVRDAVSVLSHQISAANVQKRIAVRRRSSLPINGDKIQLQQVIINLIVNAIDAMSDVPPKDRQLAIWTVRRDGFAEVAVADTGSGIHVDRIDEVFQPFVTTKSTGMGMGLSISRTIVEAHGGTITADNQASGGAVFRVRLPLRKLL